MGVSKYIIAERQEKQKTAGSKALDDILDIVSKLGYIPLDVFTRRNRIIGISHIKKEWGYCHDYAMIYRGVPDNSILLLQNPFYERHPNRYSVLKGLKRKKDVKYISIVHDVLKLRDPNLSAYADKEFAQMMELADVLVLHNDAMKRYFIEKGANEYRIVVLGIFDYLTNVTDSVERRVRSTSEDDSINSDKDGGFSKIVNIAGNLNLGKSGYLSHLRKVKGVTFNLYGVNYDEEKVTGDNVFYKGVAEPEELPRKLSDGFGLVWDGDSVETCGGSYGQYLRYNNPHKLSLYLASGLPVILWEESAEAEFVKVNKCGITVQSLYEIGDKLSQMPESEYVEMAENSMRIGRTLREGECTKRAIIEAEKILEKMGEC